MGESTDELRRDLTLTGAASLVVGIVIGTGIFLKTSVMTQEAGSPGLVLAAWIAQHTPSAFTAPARAGR